MPWRRSHCEDVRLSGAAPAFLSGFFSSTSCSRCDENVMKHEGLGEGSCPGRPLSHAHTDRWRWRELTPVPAVLCLPVCCPQSAGLAFTGRCWRPRPAVNVHRAAWRSGRAPRPAPVKTATTRLRLTPPTWPAHVRTMSLSTRTDLGDCWQDLVHRSGGQG